MRTITCSTSPPAKPGLLECCCSRIGRLVSKNSSSTISVNGARSQLNSDRVYRLRKKIEPSGVRISTVRGLGYASKVAPAAPADSSTPRPRWPARRCAEPGRRRDGHAGPSRHPTGAPSSAADEARALRPPDETDAPEAPRRSLFGEILDWMLAPLLRCCGR